MNKYRAVSGSEIERQCDTSNDRGDGEAGQRANHHQYSLPIFLDRNNHRTPMKSSREVQASYRNADADAKRHLPNSLSEHSMESKRLKMKFDYGNTKLMKRTPLSDISNKNLDSNFKESCRTEDIKMR